MSNIKLALKISSCELIFEVSTGQITLVVILLKMLLSAH